MTSSWLLASFTALNNECGVSGIGALIIVVESVMIMLAYYISYLHFTIGMYITVYKILNKLQINYVGSPLWIKYARESAAFHISGAWWAGVKLSWWPHPRWTIKVLCLRTYMITGRHYRYQKIMCTLPHPAIYVIWFSMLPMSLHLASYPYGCSWHLNFADTNSITHSMV